MVLIFFVDIHFCIFLFLQLIFVCLWCVQLTLQHVQYESINVRVGVQPVQALNQFYNTTKRSNFAYP